MRTSLALLVAFGLFTLAVSASAGGRAVVRNGAIVVAAERPDRAQLVALDLRSGTRGVIRGTAGSVASTTSPDGRRVAFVVEGDHGLNPRIWVVRTDGTARRLATRNGFQPAWSPDGRSIAFVRAPDHRAYCYATDLMIERLSDRKVRRLHAGPVCAPAWSPNGAWIAFVRDAEAPGVNELYVVRPDGSDAHRIARARQIAFYGFSWSPDSRRIVFVAEPAGDPLRQDLYSAPIDGGASTRITNDPRPKYEPQWSPDGRRIAFWVSLTGQPARNAVVVVPASGGSGRVVGFGDRPAWAPGGKTIAYFSEGGITVVRADGSRARVALRRPWGASYDDLRWFPKGRRLLFSRSALDNRSRLFAVGPVARRARALTPPRVAGVDPSAAPDGRRIAFALVHPAGNRELAVIDRDGRHLRRLTRNRLGWDSQPAWSPDGRRLVFVRIDVQGNSALYVVDVQRPRPRLFLRLERPSRPAWSPDGRTIAVGGLRSGVGRAILLIDVRTRTVRAATHPEGAFDVAPAWSPDGTKLSFVRRLYCFSVGTCDALVTQSVGKDDLQWLAAPFLERNSLTSYDDDWAPDGWRIAAVGCLGHPAFACTPALVTMDPDGSAPEVLWGEDDLRLTGVSWSAR